VLEQLARDTALNTLPPHDVEFVADEDWARSWMDRYRPMRFGRRLWVCPSWLTPPDPDGVTLMLDPGLAFGSGTHATTALCLEWLERQTLTGKTVIDYGCGSGILAIAALKLGARAAWGIDTDPQALAVSRENATRNGIGRELTLLLPEQAPADLNADSVLANILAGPLVELAGQLTAMVRPGGGLALSGILANQVEEVSDHYVQDFDLTKEIRDDWALLSGVRRTRRA
jgi:ribosomal protein L11 methyltransferase